MAQLTFDRDATRKSIDLFYEATTNLTSNFKYIEQFFEQEAQNVKSDRYKDTVDTVKQISDNVKRTSTNLNAIALILANAYNQQEKLDHGRDAQFVKCEDITGKAMAVAGLE